MNETRKKMFDCAKELFFTQGYDKTSVREIAKAADANSGLFNYYFKNKYNIGIIIFDNMYEKVLSLTDRYLPEDMNPAVRMGVMMRLHAYSMYSDTILPFTMDSLKSGFFEDSVLKNTHPLNQSIADYYKTDHTEEDLHLLLSITIAAERVSLLRKVEGNLHYDLRKIADIIFKIHLQGYGLDYDEIARCTDEVVMQFDHIRSKHPDFIDIILA